MAGRDLTECGFAEWDLTRLRGLAGWGLAGYEGWQDEAGAWQDEAGALQDEAKGLAG